MGLVTVAPSSEYIRAVAPVLEAKRELGTDSWVTGQLRSEAKSKTAELGDIILKKLPEMGAEPERFKFYLEQSALASYVAAFMQPFWARCFRGKTEPEMDRIMRSFALENCRVNPGLKAVLQRHMAAAGQRSPEAQGRRSSQVRKIKGQT